MSGTKQMPFASTFLMPCGATDVRNYTHSKNVLIALSVCTAVRVSTVETMSEHIHCVNCSGTQASAERKCPVFLDKNAFPKPWVKKGFPFW